MSLLRLEMKKKLEMQIIAKNQSPIQRVKVVSAIDYTPGIRVSLSNQSRNFNKFNETKSLPTRFARSTMTETLIRQKYADAYQNP